MTIEETRQLGIEFERRIQTMIPETEFSRKLDTDTIYSYLNQYQDKYVNDMYISLDSIKSETKLSAKVDKVLQTLLDKAVLEERDGILNINQLPESSLKHKSYAVPENFGMYLKSFSTVSSAFRYKDKPSTNNNGVLKNSLISQNDSHNYIGGLHDSLRILRTPLVFLSNEGKKSITVIHDNYTDITKLLLYYYRKPQYFNVMPPSPCELPIESFDDIVTGAVELYVQYVAGAEARRRQQQEAAQKRAREDQRDSRRSGGNQDVQQ